ncbi:MAG: hypothetical protein P3T54_01720 [Dehalogenimonas sp.]|uniref:Secreted protein n=1 Tax=Candidatus Dehalogenimonas loeffleri TaxID=3127115 RepID=A0ABZ2J5V0_9CHLR|nr:hypothetical protein [Dehalogenimonas sp.]
MVNTLLVTLAGAAVLVSTSVGAVVASESQSNTTTEREQNRLVVCEEPIQTQAQLREMEQLRDQLRSQTQTQDCLDLGAAEQNRLGQNADVNELGVGYHGSSEVDPSLAYQLGEPKNGNSYGESGDGTGPGDQRQWGKS